MYAKACEEKSGGLQMQDLSHDIFKLMITCAHRSQEQQTQLNEEIVIQRACAEAKLAASSVTIEQIVEKDVVVVNESAQCRHTPLSMEHASCQWSGLRN